MSFSSECPFHIWGSLQKSVRCFFSAFTNNSATSDDSVDMTQEQLFKQHGIVLLDTQLALVIPYTFRYRWPLRLDETVSLLWTGSY
jgi:hypothetical protein